MTSSNGNIFRVTGHLCGEVTGEFPAQRPVTRNLMFSLIFVWINGWVNNREASDLRRYRAHYDVIVMKNAKTVRNARCVLTTTEFSGKNLNAMSKLKPHLIPDRRWNSEKVNIKTENKTKSFGTGGFHPTVWYSWTWFPSALNNWNTKRPSMALDFLNQCFNSWGSTIRG